MHEFSVAKNIFKIVEEQLKDEEYTEILAINVEIGEFSCIHIPALEFCFESVVNDTFMRNCKLKIKKIDPEILCNNCNRRSKINADIPILRCPECESTDVILQTGEEFMIKSIEVE